MSKEGSPSAIAPDPNPLRGGNLISKCRRDYEVTNNWIIKPWCIQM